MAGLTQGDLAARSGVSVSSISELERGVWQAPRRDSAELLADALGLDGVQREAFLRLAGFERQPPPEAAGPEPCLFGREEDLAALLEALARPGPWVVTVVGPGGVGKTTLARAAARRWEAPVAWVALEAVADPSGLLPAVARAVGVGEGAAGPLAEQVGRRLRAEPRLLVLDNLEHLLGGAADLAALLAADPEVRLLVTSRQPSRLRGERLFPLAPLPVPGDRAAAGELAANPAVALFAARAAAAGVRAAALDAAGAARVVRLVDGLPLAIELAAAQAVGLSATALADLLELAGLRALDGGVAGGPARFGTMEQALRWSYRLLGERERRLLRWLGVFRGGFAPAEVATVVGADAGLLPRLVQASLVRDVTPAAGPSRLALLEPIRLFALQELEAAGELPAARAAHASAYAALALRAKAALLGPLPEPGMETLDRERGNVDAMLEHVVAHDPVLAASLAVGFRWWWEERGELAHGEGWLERIAAADAAADPLDRIEVRVARAVLASFRDDFPTERAWSAMVWDLARAEGTDTPRGIALLRMGEITITMDHDLAAAVPLLEEALTLLEGCERPRFLMWALARRGIARVLAGNPADGVDDFRQAVAIQEREGLTLAATALHAQLAWALTDAGRPDEARAETATTLRLCARFRSVPGMLMNSVGTAFLLSGDPDPAVRRTAAIVIGAAEATAQRHGIEFGDEFEQRLAAARARLAIADPDDAIAEGAAMPLADVVALALGGLAGPRAT